MQEVFYEESANLHNEKPAKTRYTIFTIVGVICIISAVFSIIMIWAAFITPMSEEQLAALTVRDFLLSILPLIILFVLMLAGAIFLFKKRHSVYLSYDYTFVSGELRVSKVIHNRKRKLLYRLSDERLIKIGRVGSESYKKLKASPDNKEDILTPNDEAAEGKEFFYIQASTNVGKKILVFECRMEMVATILRFINKNILESEFRQQTYQNKNAAQNYGNKWTKTDKTIPPQLNNQSSNEIGKCPNCGGKMKENGQDFVCPYCGTRTERR